MASTYHALFYHVFFHTKYNDALIDPGWESGLYAYICARVAESGGFVLAIGGIDNHIHFVLKLKPTARISDLMRRVKGTSSRWVHEVPGVTGFAWQVGYTAISISPSAVASTQRYVFNQKEHHGIITPRTELITTLNQCGIEFDPRFLPDI